MDNSVDDAPLNATTETILFDKKTLRAKDKETSLLVLANCVYLVNATILKERNLLPAELFLEHCVYDSVFGYTVNQAIPDGSKLSVKLKACHDAIQQQRVHKLALVVEENLNSDIKETFVWHFSYDLSTSARASIKTGEKHMVDFNVDVRNMRETCQQFCKVFSELREILNHLQPMPQGMIPSLRVAFRDDESKPDGFRRTDTFVNVEELSSVGHVAFPQQAKLHLQYHSLFRNDVPVANDDLPVGDMSYQRIEGPRNGTMNDGNIDDDFDYPGPRSVDDLPDASIRNNVPDSRIEEEQRLQSEIGVNDPQIHQRKENEPENHPSRIEHPLSEKITPRKTESKTPKQVVAEKTVKKRRSNSPGIGSPKTEDATEIVPHKKRQTRRLVADSGVESRSHQSISSEESDMSMNADQIREAEPTRTDKEVVDSSEARRSDPQQEDANGMEATNVNQVQQQNNQSEENETDSMDVAEDNLEKCLTSKSQRRFGRVKSVLDTDETQKEQTVVRDVPEVEDEHGVVSVRFGSTRNFADLNLVRNEKLVSDVPSETAEPEPAKRFGRVASIMGPTVDAAIPLQEQSRSISPRLASQRNFGRVSSILGLVQQNSRLEVEPLGNVIEDNQEERGEQMDTAKEQEVSANRYGRVSSLTSQAEKRSKYGHSSAIRPN